MQRLFNKSLTLTEMAGLTLWRQTSAAMVHSLPGPEPRRWKQYHVVPSVQSEDSLLSDVDGDGKPELVYIAENFVRYAKPTRPIRQAHGRFIQSPKRAPGQLTELV
jgi:hypothetical protein